MEQESADGCFLLCFYGVISTCRNVFPITFLHVKKLKIAIAGGAFSKNHTESLIGFLLVDFLSGFVSN